MKPEDLLNAMTDVNENYIEEAAPADSVEKKKEKVRTVPRIILRWGTVAACLVFAVTVAVPIISKLGYFINPDNFYDKTESDSFSGFDIISWKNYFSNLFGAKGHVENDLEDGPQDHSGHDESGFPSFYFNSVPELYLALNSTSSDANKNLNSIIAAGGGRTFSRDFNNTITAFENGTIKLFVPYDNGNQIKLNEKVGFYPINLFSSELYGLPWIWYRCDYSGKDINVCIAYPSVVYGDMIKDVRTCSGLLDIIAPSGPNVSTAEKYKESYSAIYSDNVILCDGTETEAVFFETCSGEVFVMMYYKDVLVSLRADKSFPFDAFIESFSLEAE